MKTHIKRCIALLCAVCMMSGLSACGEDGSKGGSSTTSTVSELSYDSVNGTAVKKTVKNNKNDTLANVSQPLNVSEIKSNLKYLPQMFYGCYAIDGCYQFPCSSSSLDKYKEEMDYVSAKEVGISIEQEQGEEEDKITTIPFRIEAGAGTLLDIITTVTSRQWMCMYFQSESGSISNVMGAYEINDNVLKFTPLNSYTYDEVTDKVDYKLSDKSIEYTFTFNSPNLTLKKGDKSVTLTAKGLSSDYEGLSISNYATQNSKKVANIERFDIYSDGEEENALQYFKLSFSDNSLVNNAVAEFSDNGLFTFSWKSGNSEKSYQYYYFFAGNDGLVLTDGKDNYFYNDSYSVKNQALVNSISKADIKKVQELDEKQIEIIVKKKTNLLEDLEKTFKEAGINVKIDKESGEIMLDSNILFGYDSATLSAEGKSFLNKFLKAYSSVILKKEYEGFVSKILVEGHTDSSGSYDYNKKLSQNRADNVKNYCLSDSTGLNKQVVTALSKLLQSVGRSSDEPILDKNGKEDEKASRRVTFKFNINLEMAQ